MSDAPSSRSVFEIEVDEIGPALRYATAKVTRTPSQGGGNYNNGGGYNHGGGQSSQSGWNSGGNNSNTQNSADPWANSTQADEPPF